MKSRLNYAFALFFLLPSSAVEAAYLTISNVVVDGREIKSQKDSAKFGFSINQAARVTLSIYDENDRLVYISEGIDSSEGEGAISWNGRDSNGISLPNGYYFYTIKAEGSDGSALYDLTDITGGETVRVVDISHDESLGVVKYKLSSPSRIFVRAGIKNAFVVNTIVNGEVRPKGDQVENWDFMDASGVFSLKGHKGLRFYGEGYVVSDNWLSIDRENEVNLSGAPSLDKVYRERIDERAKNRNIHYYHPSENCTDINLSISPVGGKSPKSIKAGEAFPLSVKINESSPLQRNFERLEIVYFLDGNRIYENEASYFPYTWQWKVPDGLSGVHYLTAFVVGFEGHFGSATLRLNIDQ